MRITRRHFATTAAALIAASQFGCSTLSDSKGTSGKSFLDRLPLVGNRNAHPDPYPNPSKLAATWTPDTLVQTGRTPTRGFGGRVFFYDDKSRPVPVEGTLTVHGFDDQAENPHEGVKRFEFTPEQFTRHYSQTDLGASYSIWIPWDAVGGEQKRISLVTSFKSSDGAVVQGVPATLVLPGTREELTEDQEIAKFSPAYQRYRDALDDGPRRHSGLTTTTIPRGTVPTQTAPHPGITIPQVNSPKTIATHQTPSAELRMVRNPQRSQIMPASAISR